MNVECPNGVALALATVGLLVLGSRGRAGAANRPLSSSVGGLLTNKNLDALCQLAVLLERYPEPTREQRSRILANMKRLPPEAAVVLDALTEAGVPWTRCGAAKGEDLYGHEGETLYAYKLIDDLTMQTRAAWFEDARESAANAWNTYVNHLDVQDPEPLARHLAPRTARLHDALKVRNLAATAEAILAYGPRDPVAAHAYLSSHAAARVMHAPNSAVAWHHAGNAAAHARIGGVKQRADDRLACSRRLVLRAIIVEYDAGISK